MALRYRFLCDRPDLYRRTDGDDVVIQGTCNPLQDGYFFEPPPRMVSQYKCPKFDPPFVFRSGICEMCER
jgi:hypothetical protein